MLIDQCYGDICTHLLVSDTVAVAIIAQSLTVSTQLDVDIQLFPEHLREGRNDLAVDAVVHHVPRKAKKVLFVDSSRPERVGEPGLDVTGDPKGPPLQDLCEVTLIYHQEVAMIVTALR